MIIFDSFTARSTVLNKCLFRLRGNVISFIYTFSIFITFILLYFFHQTKMNKSPNHSTKKEAYRLTQIRPFSFSLLGIGENDEQPSEELKLVSTFISLLNFRNQSIICWSYDEMD